MSAEVERIGKYRVIEELDRTVHTRILRARDEDVGRDVVLKHLKSTVPVRFERSLLREIEVLSELRCANVVQLYDVIRSETDPKNVLVLEHIEGPTLAEVLKRRKAIPLVTAIVLGAELARILSEVHRTGWVHADLKPSNLILSRSNTLRLLDFNSATKMGAASQADTDGFVTHAYVSPEHLLGEPLTERADVFSLGVVLYEWISGQKPFAKVALRGPMGIEPLRSRVPAMTGPLDDLLMSMFEREPSRRPAMHDVERSLRYFADKDGGIGVGDCIHELLRTGGFATDARASVSLGAGSDEGTALPSGPKATMLGARSLVRMYAAFGIVSIVGSALLVWGGKGELAASGGQETTLVPADRGFVRVVASPWAEVFVDGQKYDVTPFAAPIPLVRGRHYLSFTHPAAPAESRTVDVMPGQTQMIDVVMKLGTNEPQGFAKPGSEIDSGR